MTDVICRDAEHLGRVLHQFATEELALVIGVVQASVAQKLVDDVIRISPVKTGRFRGSWQISRGAPDESVLPEVKGHRQGDPPVYPPPQRKVQKLRIHRRVADIDPIWISNSLNYSELLEHGAHSRQAPDGVAKVALTRYTAGGEFAIPSLRGWR